MPELLTYASYLYSPHQCKGTGILVGLRRFRASRSSFFEELGMSSRLLFRIRQVSIQHPVVSSISDTLMLALYPNTDSTSRGVLHYFET